MDKEQIQHERRGFLKQFGATVGVAGLGAAGLGSVAGSAHAAAPKGNIPSSPIKVGHITFLTGPAELLGGPGQRGHILAQEEINAQGGVLGKRKIETIFADEAAGTDANVKELRRMKLAEKIDLFTGVISSGNTPALGPVAEELKVLTLFNDGCTDFLFDKAVPNPKYTFRVTNIQSADGVTAADRRRDALAQGEADRLASSPITATAATCSSTSCSRWSKLLPGIEVVSEAWPKLGTTDFTSHITKILSAKPDLLIAGVWGGDYVAFYKQALRYGLFDKMKVATTLAFGGYPHAIGKDHPEGVLAGVHANYHFLYPAGERWPINKSFVERYHKRWNEYPSFESDGAYVSLYLLKRRWRRPTSSSAAGPEDDAIIAMLEGMGYDSPAGYVYIRPDNHQGYKDAVIGLSKNLPAYDFPVWDSNRIITIPDPEHHRAAELAETRPGAQRVDRGGRLDQEDLAASQGVDRDQRARSGGRGWLVDPGRRQ